MNSWYAVYVKSRHEFVARGELTKKGIETFLPVARRLSQWKDRKKLIEFPLFPSYLFVYVQPQPGAFLDVLKTRGAVQIISLEPGNPTPVCDQEISSLRLLIESGEEFDVYPHMRVGDRVRVKRGPLAGAEGTLEVKNDQYRFLVNVELLGRSIGVNIYADDIESA
jgi:transcription termination/antitermination protein NusG